MRKRCFVNISLTFATMGTCSSHAMSKDFDRKCLFDVSNGFCNFSKYDLFLRWATLLGYYYLKPFFFVAVFQNTFCFSAKRDLRSCILGLKEDCTRNLSLCKHLPNLRDQNKRNQNVRSRMVSNFSRFSKLNEDMVLHIWMNFSLVLSTPWVLVSAAESNKLQYVSCRNQQVTNCQLETL